MFYYIARAVHSKTHWLFCGFTWELCNSEWRNRKTIIWGTSFICGRTSRVSVLIEETAGIYGNNVLKVSFKLKMFLII